VPFAPALRAKKRIHGSTRLTGSDELSAVAPGPSWSACVPAPETCHGSFPATTEAFPVNFQDAVPLSKPRFGKAQYASLSPHAVNGYVFAPQEGRSDVPLADAAGTESPAATTTAAKINHRRLENPMFVTSPDPQEQSSYRGPFGSQGNHSTGGHGSLERGFLPTRPL
jgi:hypothetical protein